MNDIKKEVNSSDIEGVVCMEDIFFDMTVSEEERKGDEKNDSGESVSITHELINLDNSSQEDNVKEELLLLRQAKPTALLAKKKLARGNLETQSLLEVPQSLLLQEQSLLGFQPLPRQKQQSLLAASLPQPLLESQPLFALPQDQVPLGVQPQLQMLPQQSLGKSLLGSSIQPQPLFEVPPPPPPPHPSYEDGEEESNASEMSTATQTAAKTSISPLPRSLHKEKPELGRAEEEVARCAQDIRKHLKQQGRGKTEKTWRLIVEAEKSRHQSTPASRLRPPSLDRLRSPSPSPVGRARRPTSSSPSTKSCPPRDWTQHGNLCRRATISALQKLREGREEKREKNMVRDVRVLLERINMEDQ